MRRGLSRLSVWHRITAIGLLSLMGLLSVAPRAAAGFVPSRAAEREAFDREADMQAVRSSLENKMVAGRLRDLGYSTDEIDARLLRLNDAEVHKLATHLEDLQSGSGALGAVLTVLLIVLVVVVILKLMDREIVVT